VSTDAKAPPSPAAVQAYQRADAEARAALAVLCDPSTEPESARVHLVRGLGALARVVGAAAADDVPDDPAEALETIAAAWGVDGKHLAARYRVLVAREVEEVEEVEEAEAKPAEAEPGLSRRRELEADAKSLVLGVRAAETALYGEALRKAEGRRWMKRLLIATAIVVPGVAALVITMPTYREGQWRGAYFESKNLDGDPHVRRDGDLRFIWDEAAPIKELPRDGFSVQWDTCMALDEPHEIVFQLTSDDGSRLYIDGIKTVDNWGSHGERTRADKVELDPGVHHLRVEYFDNTKDAAVTLVASMEGERPHQIPVRVLHYPGDTLDEDDPCGAVRESLGQSLGR